MNAVRNIHPKLFEGLTLGIGTGFALAAGCVGKACEGMDHEQIGRFLEALADSHGAHRAIAQTAIEVDSLNEDGTPNREKYNALVEAVAEVARQAAAKGGTK